MLKIIYTIQFKKDYKLAIKRHENIEELFNVIEILQRREKLPPEKKDHSLAGNYKGYRNATSVRIFYLFIKSMQKYWN